MAAEVEVVTGPGLDLDPDLGQDQDHHIVSYNFAFFLTEI